MRGLKPEIVLIACAASLAAACGGDPAPTQTEMEPLEVAAHPPGSMFAGFAIIELRASRPADIYYTLNANSIDTDGMPYVDALIIEDPTVVKFMAVSEDGVWSEPVSEFYTPAVDVLEAPEIKPRSLELDRDSFFFTVQPGVTEAIEETFVLRSIGTDSVHIDEVAIAINPAGWGFYEEGVFALKEHIPPTDLWPGTELSITVRYTPTQTLRSAMLVIVSDDERSTDGITEVELWGRVINW